MYRAGCSQGKYLDRGPQRCRQVVLECVIETKALTLLQFFRGQRGDLHVTLEGGTSAAWLYDLIQPHVTEVVVCDPRQNVLLTHGNKSDRIDARKLADLLRGNQLKAVDHGEQGVQSHGLGSMKNHGRAEVFFLDFPLYRTSRALTLTTHLQ